MKFIYYFADMQDVKTLYKQVEQADLMVPLKTFDQIKTSLDLPKPLAISNYLENLHPGNPFNQRMNDDLDNWKGIEATTDDGKYLPHRPLEREFTQLKKEQDRNMRFRVGTCLGNNVL